MAGINRLPKDSALLNGGLAKNNKRITDRYKNTDLDVKLLELLNSKGFFVSSYTETSVQRGKERERLLKPYKAVYASTDRSMDVTGHMIPTITQIGSHDGSTKLSLQAGCYGIVGENFIAAGPSIEVKHIGTSFEAQEIFSKTMQLFEEVRKDLARFFATTLSVDQILAFATEAAAFKPIPDKYVLPPEQLIAPSEDLPSGNTLWAVFSRAHNRLIQGTGVRLVNKEGGSRKSRPLTNIKLEKEINEKLWSLALKYLG